MNEKTGAASDGKPVDPKIAADWARVEARRADLNSRTGGDARRQAILKRLASLGACRVYPTCDDGRIGRRPNATDSTKLNP